MPREKDPFREHVEFLQNGKWRCNFCNKEYRGSVTRIKAHLAGFGGYGILGCNDVNSQVRSEARKALKAKGAAESSCRSEGDVEEGPHQPVTANNEDARGEISFAAMPSSLPLLETNLQNQSRPAQIMIPPEEFSFWPQPAQPHAGHSCIQPPNFSYSSSSRDRAPEALTDLPRPVTAEEREPNTEVPQDGRTEDALVDNRPRTCGPVEENVPTLKRKLEELSSREADMKELDEWWGKAKRIKGEYWNTVQAFREGRFLSPQQAERVDNLSKGVEEILGQFRSQKGWTTHAAGCRKSSPLVTTKLGGRKSEMTIEEIYKYLMEDEIVIVGVYGMGGVGKTAILMHVHNRVLANSTFEDVFWVSVPQEFSVYELQDEIANVVGLDNLLKDKDTKRRASILYRHLKKKRSVLLLDGLWTNFKVEDVGIPIEKGDLKLVVTTRSLDVCHKMLCQKQIKIEPLDQGNDWDLFVEVLCFRRKLPPEVEKIATSILHKFGGLPLGIIEVATRMRGVEEVHQWKDMLQDLEDSRMEPAVFKRLELSYINLGDPLVQQCFLHIILCFGEYIFKTNREALIESFIDESLLRGIATRQKLHDQGNTILDKIGDACLWSDLEYKYLYVHPLIRDMALQIVTSTKTHMVKAKMGLEEIPEEESWTDHLEKVFLQSNNIKEIPDGISPNCPKLTRLSLNDNVFLQAIHESFFRHLKGLKVLDLSNTGLKELPDAISHLESLEALLLRGCEELRRIPCVRKLGSLRKLDLNGCVMLDEVPEGMEMLVKLRYLDLGGTKIERLPEGVLGKLVNLQYLAIKKMRAGEEIKLNKVEALHCSVPNVETFKTCVRFLQQNSSQEYHLKLDVSEEDSSGGDYNDDFRGDCKRYIWVDGEIGGDGCALLLKNVQVLDVGLCNEVTSLSEVGPLENLEELTIEEWEKLEELGAVHFPRLRRLNITACFKLKHLLEEGQGLPRLKWIEINESEELEEINIAAPCLEDIFVRKCPKMRRAVQWEWLATHHPYLKSITIENCEKLEEIIGGPFPIGATCHLTMLEINGCNNMKGVLLTRDMSLHLLSLEKISVQNCWDSIERICIDDCPKLKRLFLLDNGLPSLKEICVQNCKGIEVIIGTVGNLTRSSFPKLTHLTLGNLPELNRIYDGTMSCDSIERICIDNCPKLKRLSLLDNELPSPPHSLREIRTDWQTWARLEWDHPLAYYSLEPIVDFIDCNGLDKKRHLIIKSYDSIAARVDGEIGGVVCKLVSKYVQALDVKWCRGMTNLSEVGPLENLEELTIEEWEKLEELGRIHFPRLEKLNIAGCPKLRRVVEWEWLTTGLPKLEDIKIRNCGKLEEIIGGASPSDVTCPLTSLYVEGCNNIRVLVTHDMLLHLPSLWSISVKNCKGIEVIIDTVPNTRHCSFQKLTDLTLKDLPELESICGGNMSFPSLDWIYIDECPKLKRIPLQLLSSTLSSRWIRISRQKWQSLEWDHPDARSSFERFVHFIGKSPTNFTFRLSPPSPTGPSKNPSPAALSVHTTTFFFFLVEIHTTT